MKNYLELSNKTIKVQKKRATLTIVGIILSVALITGLGIMVTSWQAAYLKNAIKDNGDFYTLFTEVTGENAKKIIKNVAVEKSFVTKANGYAVMAKNNSEKGQPPYQYLNIRACSRNTFNMYSFELAEGTYPLNPNEIALENWALKNFPEGTKIGDTITLDIGDRFDPSGETLIENLWDENETFKKKNTKEFKLVGIVKPKVIKDRNFSQALISLDENSLDGNERYNVYCKLVSPKNVVEDSNKIAKAAGVVLSDITEIKYNDNVLRIMGESVSPLIDETMRRVIAIAVLLIVIATIAVIHNAFNMSVVEKVSQFGLLRCIGATPKQIRKIVYREAYILGAIGVPIGTLCGILAMAILFAVIKALATATEFANLDVIISVPILIGSIAIGIVTIFISAWLPARRAGKVSPIEAVRNTGEFKKENFKRISRSKLLYRLGGTESWIAWKNIGRNRKRFYITVFSMVVSIVLFISFGSMVDYAYNMGVIDKSTIVDFNLKSRYYGKPVKISEQDEKKIYSINGLENIFKFARSYSSVMIEPDKMNPSVYDILNSSMTKDESGRAVINNCNFMTYGNVAQQYLKDYIVAGKTDILKQGSKHEVIIVNKGRLYDVNKKRIVFVDITSLKPGDEITLSIQLNQGEKVIEKEVSLKIAGIVDQGLFGEVNNIIGGIDIIASEELYKDIIGEESFPQNYFFRMEKGVDFTSTRSFLDKYTSLNPDVVYLDYQKSSRNFETTMLVLSIFVYGFIAVIALIGCVNIVNTISTNIILRKKELTMLKALGATQKSIRKLVCLESILHGTAAVIIGSILGCLLSRVLYNIVINVREFQWNLPLNQLIIAVVGTLFVTVISGLIPLKRINEAVIIEGIRAEE